MKTRIKTGKVSLIVFIAVMAVCVAGVAIWCYAVGYQVKEHRQGGSVTRVEYNGSTYYRMDGLTGEYCNFITDHRVSYKPRPVLSRAYYTLKNDPNGDYLYSTAFRDHILYTRLSARRMDQMSQNQITSVLVSPSGGESKKQFINDPAVVAYCAALKEEKYRAQEAKNEERSNIDDENPIAKKEEDPAAKTFQKNTNSGWYTLYFAYDHAPICGTEFVIVAEYDGVFYVEKEITDRTFTGTPVDFPPLEKACRSLPHNAADGK